MRSLLLKYATGTHEFEVKSGMLILLKPAGWEAAEWEKAEYEGIAPE